MLPSTKLEWYPGQQYNPGSLLLCTSSCCFHVSHALQGHLYPKQLHPLTQITTAPQPLWDAKLTLSLAAASAGGSHPHGQASGLKFKQQLQQLLVILISTEVKNAAAVTHLPPWGQGSRRSCLRKAAGSSQLLMTDTVPHSQAAAQIQCDKMFKPISPLGFANALSLNLTSRPWEYLFARRAFKL